MIAGWQSRKTATPLFDGYETHRKRAIWIDAICINQQDDLEKNHQVAMMSDIYQRALRVLVWLGESSEERDYALQWCTQISRISSVWAVASPDIRLARIVLPRNIRRCCLCLWEVMASSQYLRALFVDYWLADQLARYASLPPLGVSESHIGVSARCSRKLSG